MFEMQRGCPMAMRGEVAVVNSDQSQAVKSGSKGGGRTREAGLRVSTMATV